MTKLEKFSGTKFELNQDEVGRIFGGKDVGTAGGTRQLPQNNSFDYSADTDHYNSDVVHPDNYTGTTYHQEENGTDPGDTPLV